MRRQLFLIPTLCTFLLSTGCPENAANVATGDRIKNEKPKPKNGDKVMTPQRNDAGTLYHPADGGPAKIRYADGSEVLAGEEVTVKVP